MSTFDPTNAGQGGNRERPEPGDPEAQFYPPPGASNDQEQDRQNYTGYGYGPGYRPDMDPDGFARQQGGWQGRPGWQPWAGGGFYYRRRHFPIWGIVLAIVLVALLIKPALMFTFALAGLAFVILAFLLPFIILAMIFNHLYGRHYWGGGWRRWRGW
ncbi:MAG TPA: hypothetical protein VKT82_18365 [Ktedonobacterales bacterium]|nr:hypothetical protein [Ktedonobacterales bacterium]